MLLDHQAGRAEKIEQVLYHMKLRRLKFYGNIRFVSISNVIYV